jgi:hypothetical protein
VRAETGSLRDHGWSTHPGFRAPAETGSDLDLRSLGRAGPEAGPSLVGLPEDLSRLWSSDCWSGTSLTDGRGPLMPGKPEASHQVLTPRQYHLVSLVNHGRPGALPFSLCPLLNSTSPGTIRVWPCQPNFPSWCQLWHPGPVTGAASSFLPPPAPLASPTPTRRASRFKANCPPTASNTGTAGLRLSPQYLPRC